MMNHMKALAILAFCYRIEAAALPQVKPAVLPVPPVAVPGIVPAAASSAVGMPSSFIFHIPLICEQLAKTKYSSNRIRWRVFFKHRYWLD